jgi:hypothetical protein
MRTTLFVLAVVLSFTVTNQVKADSIDTFTYQSGGNAFVWQLPASPIPAGGDVLLGFAFAFPIVSVSENSGPPQSGSFIFFSNASQGGLDLNFGPDLLVIHSISPQLYSGPETSPTFLLGTFQLTDYALYDVNGMPATLVIASPEPSGIALLFLSLLSVNALLSVRRFLAFGRQYFKGMY